MLPLLVVLAAEPPPMDFSLSIEPNIAIVDTHGRRMEPRKDAEAAPMKKGKQHGVDAIWAGPKRARLWFRTGTDVCRGGNWAILASFLDLSKRGTEGRASIGFPGPGVRIASGRVDLYEFTEPLAAGEWHRVYLSGESGKPSKVKSENYEVLRAVEPVASLFPRNGGGDISIDLENMALSDVIFSCPMGPGYVVRSNEYDTGDEAAAACDGGDRAACRWLGFALLHAFGDSVAEGAAEKWRAKAKGGAVALLRRACNAGSADACEVLGVWSQLGTNGVPKDAAKALALDSRACSAGLACDSSGQLFEARKDLLGALGQYERGCAAGDWRSCSRGGDLKEKLAPGEVARAAALEAQADRWGELAARRDVTIVQELGVLEPVANAEAPPPPRPPAPAPNTVVAQAAPTSRGGAERPTARPSPAAAEAPAAPVPERNRPLPSVDVDDDAPSDDEALRAARREVEDARAEERRIADQAERDAQNQQFADGINAGNEGWAKAHEAAEDMMNARAKRQREQRVAADTKTQADEARRAREARERAERQVKLLGCTKGDLTFNRFGKLANEFQVDLRVVEGANTHEAWLKERASIATCITGACLDGWAGAARQVKVLVNWVKRSESGCSGLTARCGSAPLPLDYAALQVNCTHYEDNQLCVGSVRQLIADLNQVERFNTCAIQFVDSYRAQLQ